MQLAEIRKSLLALLPATRANAYGVFGILSKILMGQRGQWPPVNAVFLLRGVVTGASSSVRPKLITPKHAIELVDRSADCSTLRS
jgi:hypothetical protein